LSVNWDNIRIALAFQREVINRIISEVQPDLIHCYDWMTGLQQAMAFYRLPDRQRTRQVRRIMTESLAHHNTDEWVRQITRGYAGVLEAAHRHDAIRKDQMDTSRIAA
jgi:hypothetical protein